MRTKGYVARWSISMAVIAVMLFWSTARADHIVTFSQINNDAGGTAIMGTATGTWSVHQPTGVFGVATAASGTAFGVAGRANSTSGRGVWGYVPAAGVYGISMASSGVSTGVYGEANSPIGPRIRSETGASSTRV